MKTRIDLEGRSFGRLTVETYSHTHQGHAYWVCRCECGNSTVSSSNNLRRNKSTSCGCLRTENRKPPPTKHVVNISDRFDRLVVIDTEFGGVDSQRHLCYVCQCDCGNIKRFRGNHLKTGRVRSCGCLNNELRSQRMTEMMRGKRPWQKIPWHFVHEDEEVTVKSGYEVVYAEYLIRNKVPFEYEPDTFIMPDGRRYSPDFKRLSDGVYIEVKGNLKDQNLGKPLVLRDELGVPIEIIAGEAEISHYLPPGISYRNFVRDWKQRHSPPM